MIKRRDFVNSCGIATLMGINLSLSDELSAKGRRFPFCNITDSISDKMALGKVKWNRTDFRYCIATRDLEDLPEDVWDKQFRLAFDSWSEITPLTFNQVGLQDEFDLIISVGSRRREGFGREGDILAWAQLPPTKRFDGILLTKFDLAENWILPDSKELGTILQCVAAHEIGHLLGLPHSSDPNALMFPFYNPSTIKPKDDDVKSIQKLYGNPKER